MDPVVEAELLLREVIAAALLAQSEQVGGALHRKDLADFTLPDGTPIRLIDPGGGGIWNPKGFDATLSIVTSPDGPYADREDDGFLTYSYQSGPEGGKNTKLVKAMELGLPVIRLTKIAVNYYLPIYPVYVVGNNPVTREFTLTVDEVLRAVPTGVDLSPIERAYAARIVHQRVHQPAFRARIMLAYEGQCAVCNLRHVELLDAAHIVEDHEEDGLPEVTNGLSLCKIHHAAYDRRFLGISPDYSVHINERLLDEVDGPMLKHGLQEMDGRPLMVPATRAERPSREALASRFEAFRAG